jgi:putative toxin-antitoxin system antitoxin component (TIGR02293 family)
VLLRPVKTFEALRQCVRQGLPFRAFEAVSENFGLPRLVMGRVLGTPERTLVRRKQGARFEAFESDRLVRLARIAAFAEEVLGTREKAGRWLQKANRALGGALPIEHLDTDLGTLQVEQVLGRLAHGIAS